MSKLSFRIKRFKAFWNQFKRCKRGVVGLAIILFFGMIALFAPLISPYDPMRPTWSGYYPASEQPRLAEKICAPIWYKQLPGGQNLSENMEVVLDHEFDSEEVFEKEWAIDSPPNYSVNVTHDSEMGIHKGSIKISYLGSKNGEKPEKITVALSKNFTYPFINPPISFWIHISTYVENTTIFEKPVLIKLSIQNEKSYDIIDYEHYYSSQWVSRCWLSTSTYVVQSVNSITPEKTVFSKPGNYTFTIAATIDSNETSENGLTVYFDDVNVLLYGEVFGLLGTDSDSATPRDLFTMLLHGTRISFMIGFLCAIFSVLIGLAAGLVAGYVGGVVDELTMRFADFLLVLPTLPLMIVLVIVLGRSIWNIMGILIFMGWMGFSRGVRSMVLSLRERPFVEAAKAAGGGRFYIIRKHIFPNVFALVYVTLATAVPGAIIAEASLAWLGLGDITIPSWGVMFFNYSRAGIAVTMGFQTWYWVIPPGIAITLMAMAFILLGFSLDEVLNPKLRKRR